MQFGQGQQKRVGAKAKHPRQKVFNKVVLRHNALLDVCLTRRFEAYPELTLYFIHGKCSYRREWNIQLP